MPHLIGRQRLLRVGIAVAAAAWVFAAVSVLTECQYVYSNRENPPDLGSFVRFELPTIGRVYDANGQPLIELAREYREITRYEDIPPVVRDAILAAEDKRFFSHNGVDYWSLPRVLKWARAGMLIGRLLRWGRHDEVNGVAVFPQGGSTITQAARARQFSPARHGSGEQLPASPFRRCRQARVVGLGRANGQHAGAQARGSAAVVLARTADARAVRLEAAREGGDARPIRDRRVHGQRAVRVREGGALGDSASTDSRPHTATTTASRARCDSPDPR